MATCASTITVIATHTDEFKADPPSGPRVGPPSRRRRDTQLTNDGRRETHHLASGSRGCRVDGFGVWRIDCDVRDDAPERRVLGGEFRSERKTTAFRLVNEGGDALPRLAVDVYGEHFVVQFYGDDGIWSDRAPSRQSARPNFRAWSGRDLREGAP